MPRGSLASKPTWWNTLGVFRHVGLFRSYKEGKECSHTLAKDAKLTRDGAQCNAADLKPGHKIRVTTHNVATGIEALDKHAEFAKCSS